jgi:putative nucleotidyltransferase with HDIG domain
MATAEELVAGVTDLVTLPEVALRVNQMVDDPRVSADAIGRAIAQDAALTARVLRAANSPLFGMTRQIDSIGRAVTVLGAGQVRDLTLGLSAARAFDGIPNDLVSMSAFWDHSLMCAVAARLLAAQAGRGEAVFVAGLLHDIGRLVLFRRVPEASRQAVLMSVDEPGEPPMHLCERALIGTDHAEIGAALARQWRLPPMLRECLEFHHEPSRACDHPREVALVHIANSIAAMAEIGSVDPRDAPPIEPQAWQVAGVTPAITGRLVAEVREQAAQARAFFHAAPLTGRTGG